MSKEVGITNKFRIIETVDGFYIEKSEKIITKSFFGLKSKSEIIWRKTRTKKDSFLTQNPLIPNKILPYPTLEAAQKELEKIKDFPKYHY